MPETNPKGSEKLIKGITWGHSRGYTPLVAAAQRWNELHPDTTITWEKRSLQQFADYPIERLTRIYDLLIIDHPWVGTAAECKGVLPLDQYLTGEYLKDQTDNTVGASHRSYHYGGHQWALAIDAATPVASYRPDLLAAAGHRLPETWEEVLALAAKGRVAIPAIPIDLLMNFYMFCIAHGTEPFQNETTVIEPDTGKAALETMRDLYSTIDKKLFQANPIAMAEYMTTTDDYWYCPFAYGYSNYARTGYARHRLAYADLVTFKGAPLRSTLGGTGLSISANARHPLEALAFAQWLTSGPVQSTFYAEHGGQPGHRKAWTDQHLNNLTHNYFTNTLPAMDRGYLRPRYPGYLYFQDHAGDPIQEFLLNKRDAKSTLRTLDHLYQDSLTKHPLEV